MIEIKFTGSAEEVLKDIVIIAGGSNSTPGERILNIAKSADGLKDLKELKETAAPAPAPAPAPKKEEKKYDMAKVRALAAKYCHEHADGKEIIKNFLKEKGAKNIPALKEEYFEELLKLLEA